MDSRNNRYVKKPIAIEAFKYDGDLMCTDEKWYVPDWAVKAYKNGILYYKEEKNNPPELFIKTLEGDMLCQVGSYIIQGVSGELYPCKASIFEKTYEPEESYKERK